MRVINIVSIGKFEFHHKLRLEEVRKIIDKGKLNWTTMNQEKSPQLKLQIDKDGFSKTGRKRLTITLWQSGSFCVSGATTIAETKVAKIRMEKELRRIIPRVFKE